MSVILEQAETHVHDMAGEIIRRHHPHLRFSGDDYVKLCILIASQGDKECDEPAVKRDGYPDVAMVSIIPYKQRVDKRADAEFLIDKTHWENATEPEQRALLDRCITHLDLVVDDTGCVKTDDVGRPKLKLRLCDWHISGFESIARRYGTDAHEVKEARKFEEVYGKVVNAAGLFV